MLGRARIVALALTIASGFESAPAVASEKLVAGGAATDDGFLRAGPEGATYELRGGTVVRLAPATSVRFTTTTQLDLGGPGGGSTWARVMALRSGRVEVTVPATPEAHALLVNGPRKVSLVGKGARYTVFVRDGSVTFAVLEGRGLAAVGDAWRPLEGGFARTLDDKGADQKRAVVAAPSVRIERPLRVVIDDGTSDIDATWTAVPDAAAYEVSLESASEPRAARTFRVTSPRFRAEDLRPGAYAVRVRALDAQGLEGGASEAARARIVGVRLPEGAYATPDGAVQLGRSQSVAVVDPSGLEVTYGTSTHFIPAPRSISGGRAESLRVRFRLAGTMDEAPLELQSRSLRAVIQMTPRDAAWPRDDVSIRVKLVDRHGRPIPAAVKPVPTVTVNVTRTDVAWRRSGASLEGTVPAPSGKGPWVIRVEVSDQYGERLGNDFLEVTGAPASGAGSRSSANRSRGGSSS